MSVELQAMSRSRNRRSKGIFLEKLHSNPAGFRVTESGKELLTFTEFNRRPALFKIDKV